MKKMKKIMSLMLSVVMLLSCFFSMIITAQANIYPNGNANCTAYVWQRTYDKLGISLPGWGNAQDWYYNAKNQGYPVSDTPKADYIVVYGKTSNNASPGHVAYVESVSGNKMTFSEGGYKGGYHKGSMTWVKKGGYTDCGYGKGWSRQCLGYINPKKGSSSTSKPTQKSPSVSVKGASSITNYSARIDFTANNPSRVTIKTVGVQIRKKGDSSWKTKSEAMNSSYVNASSVPMWWTVGSGKEVNMALSSGTTYEYRAYVVYNGNNYYSSTASFTTSGSHTHSWGSGTVVQSPTCYAPGFREYTCSGCGATKIESIKKTSHNFVLNSKGNSNCLNPGKKTYICTTCGYTKTEDIPAKEHKFSEWKTYKEATCEEDGEQKRMCTVCGFEEVKKIPAGHKFENGYCIICGAEENEDFDDEYEDEYEEPIPPARANIKKLQSKKKTVVVLWNTVSDARGYQVQLATDKKFRKNKKSYSIGNQKANKKTVKKLKAKKKYFVRVRAFKVVDGKKTYGKWSNVKSVKTK
ncbi:CHAP domain-containing protein [uncultured Eubacterium sp.]|uniref:CHAP domain-containing protein n=1 Tax=uncultured Eubacterium sp. TaxID=165185 RepID=UPI002804C600|nr:CHAP domain-containing protein [uncultured Eubacterium sp.]